MSDLIDLFGTGFFRTGLRFGLIALGLAWLAFLAMRRRRLLPIGGLLIAAATFGALLWLEEPVAGEIWPLLLIAAGSSVNRIAPTTPQWVTPLAVVPGAAWLAVSTTTTDFLWVRLALVAVIPVGGYLIADFEKRYDGMGLGVVFYALAALGVFASVPDTEWARVLIAVAVPMVFAAWPRVAVSLGEEGGYLAVATLLLVTAQGGGPRPASMVGGMACLGLLLIEPVAVALRPRLFRLTTWLKRNWVGAVIASLPQLVVVAVCSRVAARFTNELPALVIVVLVYAASLAVGLSAASGLERKVGSHHLW